jgi:hypothetical protein
MTGKPAMRSAVLGAGRKRYSNHHQRSHSERLHVVILRLFEEIGQRIRRSAQFQREVMGRLAQHGCAAGILHLHRTSGGTVN